MKAFRIVFFSVILVGMTSCKKEDSGLNHSEIITQRIFNQDNEAFVGKWERIEMITWDHKDNSFSDFTREPLKITKKHWITEEKKRKYTMKIYPSDCGVMIIELSLETNGKRIMVPFSTYSWQNHMRFKVYEYPDDPEIFRIDKMYKPVGYPD